MGIISNIIILTITQPISLITFKLKPLYIMKKLRLTISSNSSVKLQKFADDIIKVVKQTGVVKSGPVCFKGKKLIDIYHPNHKTFAGLMKLKSIKGVKVSVEDMSNQFAMQA